MRLAEVKRRKKATERGMDNTSCIILCNNCLLQGKWGTTCRLGGSGL